MPQGEGREGERGGEKERGREGEEGFTSRSCCSSLSRNAVCSGVDAENWNGESSSSSTLVAAAAVPAKAPTPVYSAPSSDDCSAQCRAFCRNSSRLECQLYTRGGEGGRNEQASAMTSVWSRHRPTPHVPPTAADETRDALGAYTDRHEHSHRSRSPHQSSAAGFSARLRSQPKSRRKNSCFTNLRTSLMRCSSFRQVGNCPRSCTSPVCTWSKIRATHAVSAGEGVGERHVRGTHTGVLGHGHGHGDKRMDQAQRQRQGR